MKIDINKIVPNPFRDFELDPIDKNQVDRLVKSIDDLGFFSGVTARKRDDGMYELACGHHRWYAAIEVGEAQIEAVVDTYTDNEMRRIMAIENLTQRGANTGAQQDAVAAFAYQVAYEVLSDRTAKSFAEDSNQAISARRRAVLDDGPGERLIYSSINGFSLDEHMERKEADEKSVMISIGDVRKQVASLKESGYMARIVAKAYAVVEQERAEDEEKAVELERRAEEKRQREAELAAKVEQERIAKAEREARDAKAAEERAEQNKAAQAERDRLAALRAKADKAATSQRQAAMEAARKREKEDHERRVAQSKVEAEKRAKEAEERRKVAEQLTQERVYDGRCDQLFPHPDYASTFRKAVVGNRFIARDEQYEIAEAIVKGAAQWKKQSDHTVGTDYIREYVRELAQERAKAEDENRASREAELEKVNANMRVSKLWTRVKAGMVTLDQSMRFLAEEHAKWNEETHGAFPPPVDLIDTYGTLERVQRMMKQMYGDIYGGVVEHELKQIG